MWCDCRRNGKPSNLHAASPAVTQRALMKIWLSSMPSGLRPAARADTWSALASLINAAKRSLPLYTYLKQKERKKGKEGGREGGREGGMLEPKEIVLFEQSRSLLGHYSLT